MPDTGNGNAGEGVNAGAGDAVQGLQKQLAEQRTIQSGLDTKIVNLGNENAALMAQVAALTQTGTESVTAMSGLQTQYDESQAALATLTTQFEQVSGERDTHLAASLGHEDRAQRLQIVTDVARTHPAILTLAAEGALPNAETHELFRESLVRIGANVAKSVKVAANAQVAQALGGATPPPAPVTQTTITKENHWQLYNEALAKGDVEEAERLRAAWTGELSKT